MQKNQLTFLQSYYKPSKKNNGFIIEIALDSYSDIFNDFDPSPFKRRDLNPDLFNYLEDCSTDIPLKYPIIIQFNIPKGMHLSSQEQRIKDGFKTYYSYLQFTEQNKYKTLFIQSIRNSLVAFLLLLIGLTLEFHSNIIISALSNVIIIGGWVFIWQAISLMVFERNKYKYKILNYKRISDAPVIFNLI